MIFMSSGFFKHSRFNFTDKFVLIFVLFLFFDMGYQKTFSQTKRDSTDVINAVRIYIPPVIDGKLDDSCWSKAESISNFIQRELNEGEPATEKTEIKIFYDDDNLYIGVWCFDSQPKNITANQLDRDFDYGSDDNLEFVQDTYLDKRNGYHFVTNPNGARYDALISDDGNGTNSDWNGIWDVRYFFHTKLCLRKFYPICVIWECNPC